MSEQATHREQEPDGFPVREYRMAGGLRRAPLWGLLAIGLITIEALYFDIEDFVPLAIVCGIIALVCLTLYWLARRYCVRIDDRGVAIRWIRRWREWPWELFREGLMRRVESGITFVPVNDKAVAEGKPSGLRLELWFLDRSDADEALSRIERQWVPPAPPTVPEPLAFRHGIVVPWRRMVMDRHGIEFAGEKTPWRAVQRVELQRLTHDHADFVTLTIHLPKRRLRFYNRQSVDQNFMGVKPEVLAEAVRMWAGEGVILVAEDGAPRTEAEWECRCKELERAIASNRRGNRVLAVVSLLLFAPGLTWVFWGLIFDVPGAWKGSVIHICGVAFLFLMVVWPYALVTHLNASQTRRLAARLEDLQRQRPGLTPPASEPTKD